MQHPQAASGLIMQTSHYKNHLSNRSFPPSDSWFLPSVGGNILIRFMNDHYWSFQGCMQLSPLHYLILQTSRTEFSSVSVGLPALYLGSGSGPQMPLFRAGSIHTSWGNLKVVSGQQRDLKHPTCSTSVQDSGPGWKLVGSEDQLSHTMQMFWVHVGGGSSHPNEAPGGFGVPPRPCCPNHWKVPCWEVRPLQSFFRFISEWKCSDCSWILAMSGSLRYISCVWGLRGKRCTWWGVTSLSVNTSTQPQKKRWHSGLEEMSRDGVMLSRVCKTGGADWSSAESHLQSMEEYRMVAWSKLSLLLHLWLKSGPAVVKNEKTCKEIKHILCLALWWFKKVSLSGKRRVTFINYFCV